MSQLFNLDIDEYNVKELEELFSLSFPYTKSDVTVCGQKMKKQLFVDPNLKEGDKDKVAKFLENATNQLMGRLTNVVLEPRLKQSKIIDSNGHMLIVPPKERLHKSSSEWGGTVNPFSTNIWANSDKMINKLVNIDSLFRKNYFTTKSTDFRFSLPTPMKNVVSMSLSALELPLSIYAISSELGNNFFRIEWQIIGSLGAILDASGGTYIILPDGNYTDGMIECGECLCTDKSAINPASMAWELNYQLARPFIPGLNPPSSGTGGTGGLIQATIDQRTGKIVISQATDLSGALPHGGARVNFQLYFNAAAPITSGVLALALLHTGSPGGTHVEQVPIQQKLGWILGFRFGAYVGSQAYTSEGRYDFRGPRYLYLVVNDHNNNHVANHLTGVFADSLTPARQNILARLSWKQYSYFSTNNEPYDRSSKSAVTRNFFGPVNIQHLHIQLIDQFGRIVSLNNMDFALALNFSILYG